MLASVAVAQKGTAKEHNVLYQTERQSAEHQQILKIRVRMMSSREKEQTNPSRLHLTDLAPVYYIYCGSLVSRECQRITKMSFYHLLAHIVSKFLRTTIWNIL